jgi:diguanylate cyclase (GGDEF)-like protein
MLLSHPRLRAPRSAVDRCLALAAIFVSMSGLFVVCTWLAGRDPEVSTAIDADTARLLQKGTLLFDAAFAAVAVAALRLRRSRRADSAVLEHVTVQLVSIGLGLAGTFLGLATTPFALAQLGALVLGLLLFRNSAVLGGVVSCSSIALGGALASQLGWIRYGPLFRRIPVENGRIALLFHIEMMLIVALTVGLVLGVFLVVLRRLRSREAHLELLSKTDPLTGVTNRREFFDALEREMARARRRQASLAVVLLDLDHFKAINDAAGHLAGDAVLVAAARAIGEELRRGDVLARYGGEEFVVLLPDTDTPGARVVAERCRERLQQMAMVFEGRAIAVTASFGIATLGAPGSEEALVRSADEALYKAKREGRNRVEVAA